MRNEELRKRQVGDLSLSVSIKCYRHATANLAKAIFAVCCFSNEQSADFSCKTPYGSPKIGTFGGVNAINPAYFIWETFFPKPFAIVRKIGLSTV